MFTSIKARIHDVLLHVMVKLHRLSIPKIVARNQYCWQYSAVEFRPTSAILRATNLFVHLPSATFRTKV